MAYRNCRGHNAKTATARSGARRPIRRPRRKIAGQAATLKIAEDARAVNAEYPSSLMTQPGTKYASGVAPGLVRRYETRDRRSGFRAPISSRISSIQSESLAKRNAKPA